MNWIIGSKRPCRSRSISSRDASSHRASISCAISGTLALNSHRSPAGIQYSWCSRPPTVWISYLPTLELETYGAHGMEGGETTQGAGRITNLHQMRVGTTRSGAMASNNVPPPDRAQQPEQDVQGAAPFRPEVCGHARYRREIKWHLRQEQRAEGCDSGRRHQDWVNKCDHGESRGERWERVGMNGTETKGVASRSCAVEE